MKDIMKGKEQMKEIKEILELNLTIVETPYSVVQSDGATFPINDGIPQSNFTYREIKGLDLAVNALESYISSHYIAKEKVKTLKMNKYYSQIAKDTVRDYDHGYNDCVSEINKALDDLVEDNK